MEALTYLANTKHYLNYLVDNLGYDPCHNIKEYDARKCEKDCKKLENSVFAKDCEKKGGQFKCCIR